MNDLQQTVERLNELHKQTTQGEWVHGDGLLWLGHTSDNDFIADFDMQFFAEDVILNNAEFSKEIHNAWPAIAAELTRLREFEAAVRETQRFLVLQALHDLDRKRAQ